MLLRTWIDAICEPQTMDYLAWQIHMADAMKKYDHIVLFGAGNMCRNYLTNYGEQYPPFSLVIITQNVGDKISMACPFDHRRNCLTYLKILGFLYVMYYREIRNSWRRWANRGNRVL